MSVTIMAIRSANQVRRPTSMWVRVGLGQDRVGPLDRAA